MMKYHENIMSITGAGGHHTAQNHHVVKPEEGREPYRFLIFTYTSTHRSIFPSNRFDASICQYIDFQDFLAMIARL